MNWTEGSLARHSRGRQRNALIARQKQHFAKIRSGLLNERTKSGPVLISFLPSKLTSESPHQITAPRNYDARLSTPPLSSRNQKPQPEYTAYTRNDDHEDVLTNLDRRRRLLEKSDWAGLKLQEPLDISFPGQVYATKRWARVPCPQERVSAEPRKYATSHVEERHKRLKRSSMRIQIGSQVIQPSIVTGSQPSFKQYALDPERSTHRSQHRSRRVNSIYSPASRIDRHGGIVSDDSSQRLPTLSGEPGPPINVVYSSTAIHEPVPRRDFYSQTQQWLSPSSEDRESMQVEIERAVRPVPPSQESEQQRWKDWILCEESSNVSSVVAMATSEIDDPVSGSSVVTLPSHLQPRLPSLRLSSEPDLAPQHNSPEHSLEHNSIESANISHSAHQDGRHPLENCNPLSEKQQCIPSKEIEIPDDLNDIWRKFAYGDDEDSEELLRDMFKEAAHRAAVELRPSDASSRTDEYTEITASSGTELAPRDHQHKHNHISRETSSESHIATKGTTGSQTALSIIATVGSSDEPLYKPTPLVFPKAFVGKYANAGHATLSRTFDENVSRRGKKGMGKRRMKMATDGRTDIRSLPDFDGDPIEEIEEN